MNKEIEKELKGIKKQLKATRKQYEEEIKGLFLFQLEKLFADYEKLQEFRVTVSNHEFNDGDATSFYVNSEEPKLNGCYYDDYSSDFYEEDVDEGKIIEDLEFSIEEAKEVSERITLIFNTFDDIMESLYGDYTDRIIFKRAKDKVKVDGD